MSCVSFFWKWSIRFLRIWCFSQNLKTPSFQDGYPPQMWIFVLTCFYGGDLWFSVYLEDNQNSRSPTLIKLRCFTRLRSSNFPTSLASFEDGGRPLKSQLPQLIGQQGFRFLRQRGHWRVQHPWRRFFFQKIAGRMYESHLFGCEMRSYPPSVCRGLQKRSASFIIYFLALKNAYWGDNLKKRPLSTSSHFWSVIPPALPNLVI